jgi:hypothetical protein
VWPIEHFRGFFQHIFLFANREKINFPSAVLPKPLAIMKIDMNVKGAQALKVRGRDFYTNQTVWKFYFSNIGDSA